MAGVAGELILDEENGFVLPLNIEQWTNAAVRLLSDRTLHVSMSERSRALVQEYSFDNAAAGIASAVRTLVTRENHCRP
jgi:glycosyltransferase involved in cell wall biosynthesis